MFSSPIETAAVVVGVRSARVAGRAGWRTVHVLLAALLGFLLVLGLTATVLLRYSALQPSVRQLALPLTAVVDLIDAADAGDHPRAELALARQDIVRAAAPPAPAVLVPVPFLDALAAHLRVQTGRQVQIERAENGTTRLWISSARGDWIGVPLEPLRTLVAQFAVVIALIAIALAALAAWWLARRLAAPIERLARVAARLPEPVAVADFHVGGPREVQLLGDRLAEALGRIEAQRRERDLMLAGLSHDLRTPLMRLLLRIDLLDAIPEDERAALNADIGELDLRIDRFIEHARTGAEEPVIALDLALLLRAGIDASKGRGYHWDAELPAHACVRGQPGVLGRLIANLVDNAEQHGAAPAPACRCSQSTSAPQQWRLRIDNALPDAPGGAATVASHRGFGLALCRHIAQSHGGRLEHGVAEQRHRANLFLPA
jgi:two-component system osmolarity sensor histidine kinase EnvZ